MTALPPPTTAPNPPAPPPPWAAAELWALLRRPGRTFEVVLAEPARLATTIADGRSLGALLVLLLACTALAALPYGLVLGAATSWKVGALYGGSVLVCFPSLQVFAAFLGKRIRPAQSLALALVISSVGALFSLGFCPILWFLDATMQSGDRVTAVDLSNAMLIAAMLAGLVQVTRCTAHEPAGGRIRMLPVLLVWQFLVVFVTLRMARALGFSG